MALTIVLFLHPFTYIPHGSYFGLLTIGITGDPEVRCQSYYDEGYMRMCIIFEHWDALIVGKMETDLIAFFADSKHLQNTKGGGDSIHQLLKHGPPSGAFL